MRFAHRRVLQFIFFNICHTDDGIDCKEVSLTIFAGSIFLQSNKRLTCCSGTTTQRIQSMCGRYYYRFHSSDKPRQRAIAAARTKLPGRSLNAAKCADSLLAFWKT